jgi:hypothetical protein
MGNTLSFLNHLASQDISKSQLLINSSIYIALPAFIALVILFFLMPKVRGNIKKLKIYIVVLYSFCTFIPFFSVTYSSLYLGLYYQITLYFLLFLGFSLIYTICLREQYAKLRFSSEAKYREKVFIKGSNVNELILKKNKYLISSIILLVTHIITLSEIILYFIERRWHIGLDKIIDILIILCPYAILVYFSFMRYLVRCPYCKIQYTVLKVREFQREI